MSSKNEKTSQHGGEELRFVVSRSSLGAILLASSEKGVASILIGEDQDQVVEDLQSRFPEARLVPGNHGDEKLLKRIVEHIEAPGQELNLPLDIRGTPFQQQVWQALRDIPLGQTTTYTDIARKIGAPKAMRAVGNACSTNNLAIAIPCHRVLHSDGSLTGGYHWGSGRQRTLLDREAAAGSQDPPPAGDK